ncbi:hypothetical protein [Sorangium sp. So ce426]|uniref:hypothetical protein n=1 Tax=Sorangium sp. So ce426 TaxID=3133312 RepID=UPI003F5CA54B
MSDDRSVEARVVERTTTAVNSSAPAAGAAIVTERAVLRTRSADHILSSSLCAA